MVWEVAALISFIICLILFAKFISRKKRLSSNYLEHKFVKDKMIELKRIGSDDNSIFKTSGEVALIIDKYIINHSNNKRYLMCNYTKVIDSISMKVYVYNKKAKLIYVMDVNEFNYSSHSSIIKLPPNSTYINIVVRGINHDSILDNEILHNYKGLVKIETCALFFGLFPIAYLFGNWYINSYFRYDVSNFFNIFLVILCLFVSIINYTLISGIFTRIIKPQKSAELGEY